MKLLVMGANGMAGHMIAVYFMERGYQVTGFDRRLPTYCTQGLRGDAQDKDAVRDLVRNGGYTAVINCIGLLNQFAEDDKALAAYLNAYFPHFLADITKDLPTQVVHMSTDCVFSGKRGGYTEEDLRDGESFYDRSKALGELEDEKNITLRNSIVGPDINPQGIGLLNWFMTQTGEVNGYTRAVWTGQTTLQLAKTMEAAILQKASGLVNAVPQEPITKFNLLRLFSRHLCNNRITIHACEGTPVDKSLIRTRFTFDYFIPDYEIMVRELAAWMRAHRSMYPHYSICDEGAAHE